VGSLLAIGATLPGALGALSEAAARRLAPRLLRQGVAVAIGTAVATLSLPVGSAAGVVAARNGGVTQQGEEADVRPAGTTRHPAPAPTPVFVRTGRVGAASVPVVDGVTVPTTTASTTPPSPGPGWRPTPPPPRVDSHRARLLAPAPRAGTAMDARVTVRRGDSLWSIAARHLGPGASDAEIALAWPRWYAANRRVIGADPDRLAPGQQLCPPPAGEDQ
jgi:nucleoid-associated protein YgaU